MSRIGKLPIDLGDIKVVVNNSNIELKSSSIVRNYSLSQGVTVIVEDNKIKLLPKDKTIPKINMFVGLDRSNLNSIVLGLKAPFKTTLEVNGVGYKFLIKNRTIIFSLGYSHEVFYILPENVSAVFEKPNKLILSCYDKITLGKVATEICNFRKVEPYKGKGIRLQDQFVLRKEGKKK